jgi:phage-related protein
MNVFDLYAKLGIDSSEYDRGLDNAESKASGFGSKVGKVFGTVAKVSVAAFSAAATGIGFLTKKSVEGYAEQQQLVGGIETLYGDFADKVIDNANKAFVTAGKSANDYMETAITASAAMINSLGGDQAKAAELTDMAITDMADNVNKMGTSMEMVQNAYAGFSRSNFTMLDNLALGFAGTKEGMQELLDKAEEFSGIKYDISSYADIVQAIHVVQTEMGITGTTSEEAAGTITGSIEMMKAAWSNLITGMSDNSADLDGLVNNFVDSVTTVGTNLLPVIETALNGVATAIEQLLPPIAEKIPTIFLNIAPKLLRAGANVVTTLAQGFIQNAPMILQTGIDLLIELIDGLAEGLPQAIPMIVDCIMQIAEVLLDNSDKLIDAGIELLIALIEGFINAEPQFLEKMPELLEKLARALLSGAVKLADAMIKIAGMMIKNFVSKIPEYAKAGAKIIDVLFNALLAGVAGLIKIGVHLVQGIWDGISSATSWLKNKITGWVGDVVSFLKNLFGIHSPSTVMRDVIGKNLALGLYEGWEKNNPIDMINDDIEGVSTGFAVTSNINPNAQMQLNIDYAQLANAVVDGMTRSNLGIRIDNRDFGRIVREAVRYG